MAEHRVEVGATIRVVTSDGTFEGEVVEVGGRLVGRGGVDAGWVRIRCEDGQEITAAEGEIQAVIEEP